MSIYNFNSFLKGYDYYYDNSYYNGNAPIVLNSGNKTQTKDYRKNPRDLVKYWTSSKIALGVYDKINSEVTCEDFCFVPTSKNSSQVVADKLTDLLNNAVDTQLILDKIISGFWGTGGDILVYEKQGQYFAYTFFEEGQERVAFYVDQRLNKITRYDILDLYSGQTIDSVEAKDAVHLKFANPFSSILGVTPAIVLYDYWQLKQSIQTSNESIFRNGMQASKLVSLKPFKNDISQAEMELTVEQLNKLKSEMTQGSGLYNRNKTWLSGVPGVQVDDLQLSNVDMESMNVIDKIDEQTYLAFGVPMEAFNPRFGKYDDVEVIRDMVRKYIDKKMRVFTYDVVTNYILPRLIPNFKFNKYKYRYKKTITAEDLELQNLKTEKTKVFFNFVTDAKKAGLEISFTEEKKAELEEYGILINDPEPQTLPIEKGVENENSDNEEETIENEEVEKKLIEDEENQEENKKLKDQVRAIDSEELDAVFNKYKNTVNMSASELEAWSRTECSKKASLDRSPIARNIRLLSTKKSDWTQKDITDANKTISFISRMKANLGGSNIVKDSNGKECGTKAHISLKNWAYDNNKTRANLHKAKEIFKKALIKQLQDV